MNKIQEIRPEDIKKIMASDQIADALRKYKYVIGAMYHQEVSADYTFQKAYCDLYNLGDNYSEEFKTKFFFTLEELKKKSDISFRDAFEILQSFEDRDTVPVSGLTAPSREELERYRGIMLRFCPDTAIRGR